MPIATPQVRDSTIFAMINITSREPGIILSVTLIMERLRTPSVSLCQFCDVAKVAVIHRKI
jgi:hypothetical protein